MEKTPEKAKVVIDIYNIPKSGMIKSKRISRLPIITAVDAVFDMWEGNVTKLYIPKEDIPGYNLGKLAPKFKVKIEKY